MRVRVVFYGRLKQDTGTKHDQIDVAQATTVGALVDELAARYPDLRGHLDGVAYTIGAELVSPETVVREGDEVGLLPPVSGG